MFKSQQPRNRQPVRTSLRSRFLFSNVLPLVLLGNVGCFDADVMIEDRRRIAKLARLEEIDLGKFRVALPHAHEFSQTAELHFHVFGQVANRDLNSVEEVLKNKGPEIRDRLLIAARLQTQEQLEDPQLTALRESITQVVNEYAEGDPVQSVGFYRFGYSVF